MGSSGVANRIKHESKRVQVKTPGVLPRTTEVEINLRTKRRTNIEMTGIGTTTCRSIAKAKVFIPWQTYTTFMCSESTSARSKSYGPLPTSARKPKSSIAGTI